MDVYREIHQLERTIGAQASGWTIPPPEMPPMQRGWVDQLTFVQRLDWASRSFFSHTSLFSGDYFPPGCLYLTGSLIPLCFLQHQIDTMNRERFLQYADEVYPGRDINLFLIGLESEEPIDRFIHLISKQPPERLDWHDCHGRSGTSFTIKGDSWDVHLTRMDPSLTAEQVFSQQHFPFVRAWWDGQVLRATRECIESWLTRCCTKPPLFDDSKDPLRRSRNVLKYAIRGFGFTKEAMRGVRMPYQLAEWLYHHSHSRLPWYHPLYNPCLWRKNLTNEEIHKLYCCVDGINP